MYKTGPFKVITRIKRRISYNINTDVTSHSKRTLAPEVGIHKRKISRKKERKHAFDQEKSKIKEKKEENKILTKKKK